MNSKNKAFSDFSQYLADELTLNDQTLPIISQVADHLPGGFFIYKAYGDEEVIYLNKYMLRICACENMEQFQEMTGGTFRGFVYPEDYERSELAIRDCIDHSDSNLDYVEYRIKRYDGSIRWIMDYGRLAHSDQYGNVFCVFVDDSTDKNLRAEQDRRAANVIRGLSEEYNSIYLIDFSLKRMLPYSLNNEVARSMQYAFSGDQDYQTTIREFADKYVLPEDYELFLSECEEEHIRRRVAKEKTYNVIFRRYNEERAVEYIQMSISRVDDDAHCDRIVMAYKDVTERVKSAQAELRQKQTSAILRAVTEDYVCLIDVDLQTEKEIQYFLGSEETEAPLPKWSEADDYSTCILAYAQRIIAPKDRERFLQATELSKLKEVLAKQREFTIEYDAMPGDGIRKFQGRFTIHGQESGEKHMFIGIRDITEAEQLRFEEEQRLLAAVSRADEASRAKTVFLFNMSHDIRTPMNAIIGFSDLAMKHMDERERLEEYLHNIHISCDHLLSLINNVLEMSRIESGSLTLDENIWDAKAFNDTLTTVFETQMAQKGITFTRTIDVVHTDVYCDSLKLQEIFLNVLSNALKYTPAGGSVTMELKELPSVVPGYARYQTIIADTGIGMSKEYLPHIFETFSREKTSTESKVMGTGLGMPIVKQLIELMKGSIAIESEPGKGTKVTICLDHRIAAEADAAAHKVSSASPADPFAFAADKRILLAEDNDLNAEIAEELLGECGFEIERASDGIICIDMLEKHQAGYYDLILMDIQMPNMDGYKATRIIRELPDRKLAQIPIFAMTANAFEEDKQNALAAGMNGHIAKPVDIEKLMEALAQALK